MRRSTFLNLNLPLLRSSSSASTTDIESLVKNSGVNWIKSNPQLFFHGSDRNLYRLLEGALNKIESTDTGRTLLSCIESISKLKSEKLVIYLNAAELGVIAHCNSDAESFRGTGSDFHCNLYTVKYESGQGIGLTEFHACIVFHELLHVLHNLNGERLNVVESQPGSPMHSPFLLEEARTVGLGSFSQEALSENKFREEIGAPRRTFYPYDSSIIHDDDTVTHDGNAMDHGFENRERHPLL